ncbi:MAG: NAD(P)H-hydrate dehydratase [Thermoplasmata archaeon]|nr:NAD(P)H-hydrate dehydratase [Thermoplasmata archaeon]
MIHPMESKVLDVNSEAMGMRTDQLMENAGKAVADTIIEMKNSEKVLIVCGTGNNAGDGAVAARYLAQAGREVTLALLTSRDKIKSRLLKENLFRLPESVHVIENAEPAIVPEYKLIVDAMLGTGLRSEPREPFASWILAINTSSSKVISVDVPSGMGTGCAIVPMMTVTFHDSKNGMSKDNCGKILIVNIGIPKDAANYVGPGELVYYPIPAKDSHKGQNGRLLIIGGGPYAGAPALSAFAAHAIGVDLVTIASPESSAAIISSYSPNFIVRPLEGKFLNPGNTQAINELVGNADAVLIGPGLGQEQDTVKAVHEILMALKKPLVVDADGLHAMSMVEILPFRVPAVLTPHAREFTKIGGSTQLTPDAVKVVAKKYNATVLLKRPVDIISDGQRYKMNRTGNPRMSVGGTGDVLAGIVGGLLAKGVQPYEAARIGAYISGLAGDIAFENVGFSFTATDVIACIPAALSRSLKQVKC